MKKRNLCIILLISATCLILAYEFAGQTLLSHIFTNKALTSIGMIITRGLAGAVFLVLIWYMGYNVFKPENKKFSRSLLFCIPAFLVVINNLHIYSMLTGKEKVVDSLGLVGLFALECFCVALFEEMAFRGMVFLRILEKRRDKTSSIIISIFLSSAIFGLIHLVNLFYSSPVLVLMQIGYSFLVGGMCSVVLLKTHNIWLCVVLHGTFNFCGEVVPRLGRGYTWDVPTIVITVLLAVFTTVYMIAALVKMPKDELDAIYKKQDGGNI